MRKLYSANTPCHAGCQYCFARWNDIYDGQPLFENVIFDNDSIILYPCCDGEFFEQNNIINKIKDLTNNLQKVYISVSTKRNLSSEETKCLISLNKWLRNSGKGFVKTTASLRYKHRCECCRISECPEQSGFLIQAGNRPERSIRDEVLAAAAAGNGISFRAGI